MTIVAREVKFVVRLDTASAQKQLDALAAERARTPGPGQPAGVEGGQAMQGGAPPTARGGVAAQAGTTAARSLKSRIALGAGAAVATAWAADKMAEEVLPKATAMARGYFAGTPMDRLAAGAAGLAEDVAGAAAIARTKATSLGGAAARLAGLAMLGAPQDTGGVAAVVSEEAGYAAGWRAHQDRIRRVAREVMYTQIGRNIQAIGGESLHRGAEALASPSMPASRDVHPAWRWIGDNIHGLRNAMGSLIRRF
jgi:hypothetical protein